VEAVELDESLGAAVARVRLRRGQRSRCGICGRRCSLYDRGEGRRLWRTPELGTTMAFIEAEAPRVSCREHGVVVARVPWARHGARFTKDFEDQCAWLAVHVSKTTLAELVRIAWRTVGGIIGRVVAERSAEVDRLDRLSKIGIDEVSFRRGQRYLTIVVDHETARVVWAQEGRDEATLECFFDRLGPVRARREVWNEARRSGQTALAHELKGARYALWKNPEDLTRRQSAKLADIARTNKPLYRAYLLKEQLREIFRLPFDAAVVLLEHWIQWARRSRLGPFVRLARSIRDHRATIVTSLQYGLSNARVESVNTRIRLLTRIAFGFHSAQPLIAMVLLALGGLCPPLPGRS
jgi:transposase